MTIGQPRRACVKVASTAARWSFAPRTIGAERSATAGAGRKRARKKGFLIRSFAKAAPGLKLLDKFKRIKAAGFEGVDRLFAS